MEYTRKLKSIVHKIIVFLQSEKILYLVGAIVCLANALFLFDNAIWGDEGFSIVLSRRSIGEILSGTAADVHPPLYYLILKFMISLLGESVFVLHLTSFLAFVGLCILCVTYIRKNFGILSAYLALLLAGWTDYGFILSIEIRMYSMALLFIALTFCASYEVIKNKDSDGKAWIRMSIFALLAGYTHYFALLAVAFMVLGVFLLCLVKKQNNVWKNIGLTCGLCVIGYLPWLVAMVTTVERTVGGFWLTTVPTFRECMDMFLGAMGYSHRLLYIFILFWVLWVGVTIYEMIRDSIPMNQKINQILDKDVKVQLSILGIWTFVGTSLLGILVSKYLQPVLLIRYLFPMVVVGAISFGVLVQYFAEKEKLTTLMFVVGMIIVIWVERSGVDAYQQRYQIFQERKWGTEQSLFVINEYVDDGYLVMSNVEHLNWTVLEYYYPEEFVDYTKLDEMSVEINTAIMLLSQELNQEEIEQLENGKFIIESHGEGMIDTAKFHLYSLKRINP